jgi:hypothetical protein
LEARYALWLSSTKRLQANWAFVDESSVGFVKPFRFVDESEAVNTS